MADLTIHDQAELARIRVQLPRIFTPGAPIKNVDFLAGRQAQINKTVDAVSRPGQHAILWGERGVGKTSLASLIHRFWMAASKDSDLIAVRHNCDPLDDYATIWSSIAEEIQDVIRSSVIDLKDQEAPLLAATEGVVAGQATPNFDPPDACRKQPNVHYRH